MIQTIKKLISSLFIDTEFVSPASKDLHNKVVIITGASRGMGKAIAEVLRREGAKLVLVSRNSEDVKKAFPQGENILPVQADITKEEDIQSIARQAKEKYGSIDVLVNNAGIFLDKEFESITSREFESMMDTNVKSIFLLSKAVIPHMKKQKNGLIINIGSKISHNTNVAPKKVLYATTKYAVEGLSLALHKELKPFGIRVTCLMPGTVNTFVSLKSKQFLQPFSIGYIVSMIMKCEDIHFESLLFTSKHQNI